MAAIRTPDSAVFGLYFNLALAPNAFVNRNITSASRLFFFFLRSANRARDRFAD